MPLVSATLFNRFGAYLALTKPRIIELLLVTTVPAMVVAAQGMPEVRVALATLIGGSLAAGSANAFNSFWDRDIDQVMERTAHRPMARHAVSERSALIFGTALALASLGTMARFTNPLATYLTLGAILFYVLVYTILLKRRTSSNIVWGGAAGCFPVLIGWAAVTNSLTWSPVVLFFIVFFWTPPHYWPLAMRYRDQYAAAGVPMLPVVAEDDVVTRQILFYSWAMVATSLVAAVPGDLGALYLVSAAILGVIFLVQAHSMHRKVRRSMPFEPMNLFHSSITYLAVLFLLMCVDVLVRT